MKKICSICNEPIEPMSIPVIKVGERQYHWECYDKKDSDPLIKQQIALDVMRDCMKKVIKDDEE